MYVQDSPFNTIRSSSPKLITYDKNSTPTAAAVHQSASSPARAVRDESDDTISNFSAQLLHSSNTNKRSSIPNNTSHSPARGSIKIIYSHNNTLVKRKATCTYKNTRRRFGAATLALRIITRRIEVGGHHTAVVSTQLR